MRAMLKARPELVNVGIDNYAVLHYAVLDRAPEMVRVLMEHGANAREGVYPHRDATSALTIASDPDQQPITVALQGLAGSLLAQYQIQMAGSLLTALPPLIIYIALGRYFIRGLLAGALKG